MTARILSGDRERTVEEIQGRAARIAGGLNRLGIGRGDAVALFLRNDFSFFEATFGAARLGAYAVPINWHGLAEEAGYILRDSDAKALFVHADLLPQMAAGIPEGLPVLVVDTPAEVGRAYGVAAEDGQAAARLDGTPGRQDFEAWLAAAPEWTEPPPPPPAAIIYTSGTTGRPKGVRREIPTAEVIQAVMTLNREVFGLEPGVRVVISGPMYHSAPNHFGLWAVRAGAELTVLQPRFDAEDLLALVERHRITTLYMVPTMFVRLLKLPEEVRRRHDLSSLRFIVHAAAPCPPDIKRQMIEWLGPVIYEFYGSTETGAVSFATAEDALKKPGTVGRSVSGAVLKVLDAAGAPLPPGQIGEIFARNPAFNDFTYHKNPDKRAEVEKAQLFTSGDIGYIDADGYLFLCDRAKDMVISGGVNIYPAEIEACLLGLPGVQDCAVFGIPDEEYGESLAACVQLEPGVRLGEQDVRSWVRTRLAAFKAPKLVEFLTELPREDSGKIFKRKLREPYWANSGRRI